MIDNIDLNKIRPSNGQKWTEKWIKNAKNSPGEVLAVRVNHRKTKDHENYNFRQEKIQNYNIQLKITMEKISRRGAS